MDSLLTGYSELVQIESSSIRITIKGIAGNAKFADKKSDKPSTLRIKCSETFEIDFCEEHIEVTSDIAGLNRSEICGEPIFYEQQRYEIVIEVLDGAGDSKAEFWHENINIRKQVTPIGKNGKILTGVINFGNEIGYSDLVIRLAGSDYMTITVEVFPSKISYKEDYQAIIADVTQEVYALVFDFLKRTYHEFGTSLSARPTLLEFFAILETIYKDFLKAADLVMLQPHHMLVSERDMIPGHKIRKADSRTVRWIETHPDKVQKNAKGVLLDKAMAVRKQVTYDTRENRFTKHILISTVEKLMSFKSNCLVHKDKYGVDIFNKMDNMIKGIRRRYETTFLEDVDETRQLQGMSMVFTMAPGYRDLYKQYIMLQHGLSISGDLFNISEKNIAELYEYWCFIKLNSIMRDKKYELISQDIIKTRNNGIRVDLVKGVESRVKYINPNTGERIILSYNPMAKELPTVSQKPDNVLRLEKKGSDIDYEYVFDAKYRINSAAPDSYYARSICSKPGPEIDDINTMHRYRDAIVWEKGAKPFERIMFGAYVLFPYSNEEEYKEHRFFKSIDKVNIGGLPFLPSATGMVTNMLESLIEESPDSAFERTVLPKGIDIKLAQVDWDTRDVLVGALGSSEQLEINLNHKFYHIPADKISKQSLPIRYIAIYQSKHLFSEDSGVNYVGEVIGCKIVPRREIREIPKDSDMLYYRFDVKEWSKLPKPIAINGATMGTVMYTNKFLLDNATNTSELLIRSPEQYRLYTELSRITFSKGKVDGLETDIEFKQDGETVVMEYNGASISLDNEDILVVNNTRGTNSMISIEKFARNPRRAFNSIWRELI